MFLFTYRRLLSVLLTTAFASFLNAQTTGFFTPGTTIQVLNCENVEMQAIESGRLEVLAHPGTQTRIMGYTDQPVNANVEIPSNMQYWLECVEAGTTYADQHPEVSLGTASNQASQVVAPLLGYISWDQTYPYDMLCPANTPVGCVATAMAQVMYYWKYPDHGIGQHIWEWNGITHDIDFGATTYHWDRMFDIYGRYATNEQMSEVAKLSYHCGVSIDMMYESEGSGTYTQHIPGALKKYFGYNDRTAAVRRNNYSHEDWKELITAELLAGRPVVYSGNNKESGHAFVIDGIDADGLFHVNWGWGGYYNGYFDICILNPTGTGTGASKSEIGFCMNQDAVIQICPEAGTGKDYGPVVSSGMWESHDNDGFDAYAYIENYTYDTIQGAGGIQIFDVADQLVSTLISDTITLYPLYTYEYYRNRFYFDDIYTHCSAQDLPDGDYYAQLCFKAFQGDSLTYEVPTNYYQNPRLDFTVSSGKIADFVNYENKGNIITGSNFSLQGQELACGRPYDATIDITNSGNDAFSGTFYIELFTYNGSQTSVAPFYEDNTNIFIPAGGSYTAHFPVNIPIEGKWKVRLASLNYNMDIHIDNCATDTTFVLSARFNEDSPASLYLTEPAQLLTERCEVDGGIAFQMIMRNDGGKFSDLMGMQFYSSKMTSGNAAFSIYSESEVAIGAKADTIIVTGILSDAKGMKKYYALPYYRDVYGNNQSLLIIDTNNNKSKHNPIEVRVYNASGIETITVDEAQDAPAYDLYGRRVKGNSRFIIKNRKKIATPL